MKSFSALKGSYTKIPNELLNDATLSWKAKGLFCFMASKKDTYNFTMRSLAKQFPDGKTAVFSAMIELKERGWINYVKSGDGTGKYVLNTTLEPAVTPYPDNQAMPEPNPENQNNPNPENPDPENPSFRKSGRINKTDLHNKKDIYKGEDEKADVILPSRDGDPFGSSTRYSPEEILDMLSKGVIHVH